MRNIGNWYRRTQVEETGSESSSLKRGEVKEILLSKVQAEMAGFEFLDYRNSYYTFSRVRNAVGLAVNELIHIGFSLKGGLFSCSVTSRLDPSMIYENFYNTGLVNPHTELKVLKLKTGIIAYEDGYYFHDGTMPSCLSAVDEIFRDLREYGVPFFDAQFEQITVSPTLRAGFDYLEKLSRLDVEELRQIIGDRRTSRNSGLTDDRRFVELKRVLQAIPGETRETRKKLPQTAIEMIRFHCLKS